VVEPDQGQGKFVVSVHACMLKCLVDCMTDIRAQLCLHTGILVGSSRWFLLILGKITGPFHMNIFENFAFHPLFGGLIQDVPI
jgi:hypothetical protein